MVHPHDFSISECNHDDCILRSGEQEPDDKRKEVPDILEKINTTFCAKMSPAQKVSLFRHYLCKASGREKFINHYFKVLNIIRKEY